MNKFQKIQKFVRVILSVLVFAIGVKMFGTYDCPTPPAMSGVAFMLIGFSLWFSACPILNKIFGDGCGKGKGCGK